MCVCGGGICRKAKRDGGASWKLAWWGCGGIAGGVLSRFVCHDLYHWPRMLPARRLPAPVYVIMTSGGGRGGGYDAVFTRNVPGVSSGDILCNPTTPSEQSVRKARSIRNRDDSSTLCETVTTVPGPVLCVVMVQELLGWNVTLHTLIAPRLSRSQGESPLLILPSTCRREHIFKVGSISISTTTRTPASCVHTSPPRERGQ